MESYLAHPKLVLVLVNTTQDLDVKSVTLKKNTLLCMCRLLLKVTHYTLRCECDHR